MLQPHSFNGRLGPQKNLIGNFSRHVNRRFWGTDQLGPRLVRFFWGDEQLLSYINHDIRIPMKQPVYPLSTNIAIENPHLSWPIPSKWLYRG